MKKIGTIVVIMILALTALGGCARVKKNEGDKVYQDAFSEIQKKFSNYVVENYKGVKKIEWDGIDIQRYNSPTHGPSLFGNITHSVANIYVTDTQSFPVIFSLSKLADFDDKSKQFVLNDETSPSEFDNLIDFEVRDAKYKLNAEEKRILAGFKKDTAGSPEAVIKYNINMHEI